MKSTAEGTTIPRGAMGNGGDGGAGVGGAQSNRSNMPQPSSPDTPHVSAPPLHMVAVSIERVHLDSVAITSLFGHSELFTARRHMPHAPSLSQ
jgi:hypothetical protein